MSDHKCCWHPFNPLGTGYDKLAFCCKPGCKDVLVSEEFEEKTHGLFEQPKLRVLRRKP